MRLRRFVKPHLILLDVQVDSQDDLFRLLASRMSAERPSLDTELVERALREREGIGSTAVGHGVALPHARIPAQGEAIVGLARLQNPIEFNAPDGKPIWLVAFSAVDETDSTRHLQILARLSRVLNSPANREALREAKTPEDMTNVLARDDEQSDS